MTDLTPFSPLTQIIRERRKKVLEKNESKRLLFSAIRTLVAVGLFVILFNYFFAFRIVSGNGMFPALSDGDLTICYRQSEYIKDDVVFYTVNGVQHVGRVVAKGGDVVDIAKDGTLTVNGTVQSGKIVYPTYPPENWTGAMRVPNGSLFLLGDYRVKTKDSRDFGCIPIEDVQAKLITVIRHRGI